MPRRRAFRDRGDLGPLLKKVRNVMRDGAEARATARKGLDAYAKRQADDRPLSRNRRKTVFLPEELDTMRAHHEPAPKRTRRARPASAVSAPSGTVLPRLPVTQEEIAQRAYQLFLERGGQDGHAQDDWYRAERELQAGRD